MLSVWAITSLPPSSAQSLSRPSTNGLGTAIEGMLEGQGRGSWRNGKCRLFGGKWRGVRVLVCLSLLACDVALTRTGFHTRFLRGANGPIHAEGPARRTRGASRKGAVFSVL